MGRSGGLFWTPSVFALAWGAVIGPLHTDEVMPLGGILTLRPAKKNADCTPLGPLAQKGILVLRTLFPTLATNRPHHSYYSVPLLKRPPKPSHSLFSLICSSGQEQVSFLSARFPHGPLAPARQPMPYFRSVRPRALFRRNGPHTHPRARDP